MIRIFVLNKADPSLKYVFRNVSELFQKNKDSK